MAGELRRYWPLAATLAAVTGIGPAHPPVSSVAETFAAGLPCFTLALGRKSPANLPDLLGMLEVAA